MTRWRSRLRTPSAFHEYGVTAANALLLLQNSVRDSDTNAKRTDEMMKAQEELLDEELGSAARHEVLSFNGMRERITRNEKKAMEENNHISLEVQALMQNLGVSGAHANGELSILELNYLHKLSGLNTSHYHQYLCDQLAALLRRNR